MLSEIFGSNKWKTTALFLMDLNLIRKSPMVNHTTKRRNQPVDESENDQQSREIRYATVQLKLDNEHAPYDTVTLDRPVETRKQLHHFNLIDDGTIVMLYHFQGNLERVSTALTAAPNVLNFDLVDHGDCGGFAYIHCELTDPVKSIISTLHQFEVVLKMPLEFTNEETIRATLVGKESAVGDALQAISEIVEIHLEKTGEYLSQPNILNRGSALTNRQHEILTIAVRQGYYQVPRQATIEDIAAAMDLSRATVGEHLQKIEANVFSQIVQ